MSVSAARARVGRPPKYPKPEPRECENCGEPFTPKYPSAAIAYRGYGRGRFCSRQCRIDGSFASKAGVVGAEVTNARKVERVAAVKTREGLLDTTDVSERLGIAVVTVGMYGRTGKLAPTRVVCRQYLFAPADVDRFIRDQARRDDKRSLLWLDPDHVVKVRRNSGSLALFAEAHGLTEARAEAIVRAEVLVRRATFMPRRRGRRSAPGPPSYHREWAEAFAALEPVSGGAAECERGCGRRATVVLGFGRDGHGELQHARYCSRCATEARQLFHVELSRPLLSETQAALQVARADAAAHPERWQDYPPHLAGCEHEAAMRVLSAVKSLQISESRNAAA